MRLEIRDSNNRLLKQMFRLSIVCKIETRVKKEGKLMKSPLIFRAGALAALVAIVCLLSQVVVAVGLGSDIALLGKSLDGVRMTAFYRNHGSALTLLMASDDLFAVAYTVAFITLAYYVGARSQLLGGVGLLFALLTGAADFTENSVTLAAVDTVTQGQTLEGSLLLVICLLGQVKFLFIYVGVVLFAIGMWDAVRANRVVAILFVLFPLGGLPGIVIPELVLLRIVWMLVLLVAGGIFLARATRDVP